MGSTRFASNADYSSDSGGRASAVADSPGPWLETRSRFMSARISNKLLPAWWAVLGFCALGAGCHSCPLCPPIVENPEVPRELAKVSLPTYVIEPPDVLLINTLRVVPLPPYRIEPLDAIIIQATDVLPDEPINAIYSVQPEGTVNLGPSYGLV